MVGTVFFASNRCNHFAKMLPLKRHLFTFYQTGCSIIALDISHIQTMNDYTIVFLNSACNN